VLTVGAGIGRGETIAGERSMRVSGAGSARRSGRSARCSEDGSYRRVRSLLFCRNSGCGVTCGLICDDNGVETALCAGPKVWFGRNCRVVSEF